jgi:hypothetical protein
MSYLLETKKTLNQISGGEKDYSVYGGVSQPAPGQKGADYNLGIKVKDKPVEYNIGVQGNSKNKPAVYAGFNVEFH